MRVDREATSLSINESLDQRVELDCVVYQCSCLFRRALSSLAAHTLSTALSSLAAHTLSTVLSSLAAHSLSTVSRCLLYVLRFDERE